MSITLNLIIASTLIVFCASFVQGVSGFGFALFAVPLLSLFITPFRLVTPVIVAYSLITSVFIAYKARSYMVPRRIFPLIVFGILGIPLGTHLLMSINVNLLKIALGFIIIITATALYKNYKILIRNENLAFSLVGFFSGVLNGSAALSGPPIAIFLANQGTDKNTFRANLTLYGCITNIFALVSFYFNGLLTIDVLSLTVYSLPSLILGVLLGIKTADKFSEERFRKVVIFLIALIGIYTTINALINYIK